MNKSNNKTASLTAKEAAIESELGNIAKGSFIASLDHRLRAPMNSIMGMLNLLEETEINEQQRGYVDSALEASKFLLETINQITDFPVNSYEFKLQDTPFDLFKAGKNVIKAFSGPASKKKISLQFECEAETPVLLNGDPLKLQQVLAKLVENAIVFTTKGSVKLIVKCIGNDDKNATIEFKVNDTGYGISQEKLRYLFDFTNDIFSDDKKLRRVSLELAVCKTIIEEMGGQIEVTSEKEKGTEVSLQIPFKLTSSEVIDEISADQKVVTKKDPDSLKSYNGLKVLLVEDDPINQSLAVAFLTKLGGTVDTADNGIEAVNQFKNNSYDIVFMDCEMPELDGFDATREIRKFESEKKEAYPVPIIAMTAYAGRGDKENCLAAGMDDHVPKPITVNVLQEVAEKYIFNTA